jgi:N-acetylglucosamine-6-phosphate deacetylase
VGTRILIHGLRGEPSALLLDGARIAALGSEALAAGPDVPRLDATGLRAAPGFIDLQVNGIAGWDVTSDPHSLWRVAESLVPHGVTAFLPTIVSGPRGSVEAALQALADGPRAAARGTAAVPLGLHVEGPYLSGAHRGAHVGRHLRPPELAEVRDWVSGGARLITLAPELPGAMEAIERIAGDGAVAAVGHTDADATITAAAVDAGARYATHLFNGMPPLHHRAPGAAGALLDDPRVTVGLIADGVHVAPILLRLVARAAPGRVSLVSDAVGRQLGGTRLEEGDAATLADGTLAGGRHLLDHGVRTFAAATASPDAAIDAVTSVAARLLGLEDGRGTLRVGGRADVVLLDGTFHVVATIIAGSPAYVGDGIRWP